MNTMTTTNPKTLLGPGDFHDWDYERFSSKADAIAESIGWRLEELETAKPQYALESFELAIERIADNKRYEQDDLNRALLTLWQCRNAKPNHVERAVLKNRAIAKIVEVLNTALTAVVTQEVKREYC